MWSLAGLGALPVAGFDRARPGSTLGRRAHLHRGGWRRSTGRRWSHRAPAAGRTWSVRRGSNWPAATRPVGAQAAEVDFEGVREVVGAVGGLGLAREEGSRWRCQQLAAVDSRSDGELWFHEFWPRRVCRTMRTRPQLAIWQGAASWLAACAQACCGTGRGRLGPSPSREVTPGRGARVQGWGGGSTTREAHRGGIEASVRRGARGSTCG
jgi:hypothetical protein